MHWGIPTIFPLIAFLCYGALLAFVARQGLDRAVIRSFSWYLLSLLAWSFGTFMMYVDASHLVFWNRVMLFGLVAMPATLFSFMRAFLNLKAHQWSFLPVSISLFVFLVASAGGYLAQRVYLAEAGLIEYEFGPGAPAFAVYFASLIGFSGLNLIRGLRQSRDRGERNRIRYALLGVGVVFLGSMTNVVPTLGPYPLDIVANIVNALLLAYAIGRYQLLDITVVVREGLLYSVPTTIIGAGYFLLISLATRLFHAFAGPQIFLVSLVVAGITAVAAQRVQNKAQSWIDRLFFRERYDSQLMLQRLSRTAASVLDLDRLTGLILDEVTKTIHIRTAAFFLKQRESEVLLLAAQRGLARHGDLRLRGGHPIVERLSSDKDALTRHGVEMLPQFETLSDDERRDLETLRAELFVPLVAREELIGILILGPKLSEMPYSPTERLTLTTLANQVAVAIENAWLYEEIIREKERTETIVEETSAGIVVVDRGMRILALNPGAEAITGYSSQEIRGMRLPEVLGAELGQETSPLQRAILTGERVPPTETSIGGKDSLRDILLGVAPLGDGYLLSFTDITRLKEVDRLKTSIVTNVSHELRTPLSSIKAYTELLLDDVGGGELAARRQFLSVIDQQADRLSHLISDLLDLSRLESGQFEVRKEPLCLDEVIADVVGHVEMERIEKTVSVYHDLSPVRRIVADRALLRIIVENLVTNAVKFSRPGGRVEVLAREEQDNLVLQVVDRGVGISSDDMPYLFQKFRRLESAKQAGIKGTGLGLALVKEAVHAHGGSIEVQSEVGEGSCFTVRLPLRPSAHELESPQRTAMAARGVALEGELR